MVNEVEQNTFGNIEVKYNRPKFVHRLLANLIDLIIFAIVFVGLFILTRYAIGETPRYKEVFNSVNSMRLESGMYYKKESGEIVDIVTYANTNDILTNEAKVKLYENHIDAFLTFEAKYVSEERFATISNEYDKKRLESTFTENENTYHLFEKDSDNKIIKNAELYGVHFVVEKWNLPLTFYYGFPQYELPRRFLLPLSVLFE